MTYDPTAYWTDAGADPSHPEHESRFVRTPVFEAQEVALVDVLDGLDFTSILEVGCGWGRITELVHRQYPDAAYTAIDLSPERIESARERVPDVTFEVATLADYRTRRKFDLVLSVEVLMHVPGADVGATVAKMKRLARHHIVTLDWVADLGNAPIAPWNERHDYRALFGDALVRTVPIGLQAIHVVNMS